MKLSTRQRIIRQIVSFTASYGYPPTPREVATRLNLNSTEAVVYHLKALRAAGAITWDGGAHRSIRLAP